MRSTGRRDGADPARLLVAPDCGLATIDRPLAEAKVKTLVAAAHAARSGG